MRRLRVIRGWSDLPAGDRGAALAMGSFDGVHRGHQRVIALAAKAAGELGAQLGVITFDHFAAPLRRFLADQSRLAKLETVT